MGSLLNTGNRREPLDSTQYSCLLVIDVLYRDNVSVPAQKLDSPAGNLESYMLVLLLNVSELSEDIARIPLSLPDIVAVLEHFSRAIILLEDNVIHAGVVFRFDVGIDDVTTDVINCHLIGDDITGNPGNKNGQDGEYYESNFPPVSRTPVHALLLSKLVLPYSEGSILSAIRQTLCYLQSF